MHKKIAVSNKFEALEYCEEETPYDKSMGKQGSSARVETPEPTTQMEEEIGEDNVQEMVEHDTGDEAEDMDIGGLDLEGIDKACVDKGKGCVM